MLWIFVECLKQIFVRNFCKIEEYEMTSKRREAELEKKKDRGEGEGGW